jgi:hypothetical protein
MFHISIQTAAPEENREKVKEIRKIGTGDECFRAAPELFSLSNLDIARLLSFWLSAGNICRHLSSVTVVASFLNVPDIYCGPGLL